MDVLVLSRQVLEEWPYGVTKLGFIQNNTYHYDPHCEHIDTDSDCDALVFVSVEEWGVGVCHCNARLTRLSHLIVAWPRHEPLLKDWWIMEHDSVGIAYPSYIDAADIEFDDHGGFVIM